MRLVFDKVRQPLNSQRYKRLVSPICTHYEIEDSLVTSSETACNLRKASMEPVWSTLADGAHLMLAVSDAMFEVVI